jgi:hypothetical protein
MALRIHPMSASRWAQLSKSRLPIDLTRPDLTETAEHTRQAQAEIDRIQAYVDALDGRTAVSR